MARSDDWEHENDYDRDGADWRDATVLGSVFQQQIDINGKDHWRHRNILARGPWKRGQVQKQSK